MELENNRKDNKSLRKSVVAIQEVEGTYWKRKKVGPLTKRNEMPSKHNFFCRKKL